MTTTVSLEVNGRSHELEVEPGHTLLRVLREQLGLVGVREACGVGMCGACTVLVEGAPMSACLLLPSQVEGRELTTVEALSAAGELDPVQQAFLDTTGYQCSFCTPGFVLTTKALLAEAPEASRDEIREYLSGNVCRCGSYVKIVDAVERARRQLIPSKVEEVDN